MSKKLKLDCFGDVLETAEAHGFDSDACEDEMKANEGGNYTPSVADGLEEAALEFLESKGFEIDYEHLREA